MLNEKEALQTQSCHTLRVSSWLSTLSSVSVDVLTAILHNFENFILRKQEKNHLGSLLKCGISCSCQSAIVHCSNGIKNFILAFKLKCVNQFLETIQANSFNYLLGSDSIISQMKTLALLATIACLVNAGKYLRCDVVGRS